MARLLVIIILINNLYGKLLTDKEDTLKSSTYNVSVDFNNDQEIKEYCIVIENFHLHFIKSPKTNISATLYSYIGPFPLIIIP